MATVTVTELDVALEVRMTRDENGADRVLYSAVSVTDVPQVSGRFVRDVDITETLTAQQMATVASVLTFVESQAKAQWQIP